MTAADSTESQCNDIHIPQMELVIYRFTQSPFIKP